MNQLNTKILKKTIAGAGLLATTPVWAKSSGAGGVTEGGKNQSGVNNLSLEEIPGKYATLCAGTEGVSTKTGNNIMPNDINVVLDPIKQTYFEITFTVRDILAQNQDHVLFFGLQPPNLAFRTTSYT